MQNLPAPMISGHVVVEHAETITINGMRYDWTHEVSPNGVYIRINDECHFITIVELRQFVAMADRLREGRQQRQAA